VPGVPLHVMIFPLLFELNPAHCKLIRAISAVGFCLQEISVPCVTNAMLMMIGILR